MSIRLGLLSLVLLIAAACNTELPHEAPYDSLAPFGKQARSGVAGQVVLEDETDHAGIDVQLQSGSQTYSVATDADGSFRITGVVPGEYQLRASTRYFETIEESV